MDDKEIKCRLPVMLVGPEDGRVCSKVMCRVPHPLGGDKQRTVQASVPQIGKGQRSK